MKVTEGNQIWKNPSTFEVDGEKVAWVPGYENELAITEDGKLWKNKIYHKGKNNSISNFPAKWAKSHKDKDGYIIYSFRDKGLKAHRLVAETYIENPENKPIVDHINRDPGDNRKENLRWTTPRENVINSFSPESGEEVQDRTPEEQKQHANEKNKQWAKEHEEEQKIKRHERYIKKREECTEEELEEWRAYNREHDHRKEKRNKTDTENSGSTNGPEKMATTNGPEEMATKNSETKGENEMKHWYIYCDGSAVNNQEINKEFVYGGWAWALKPIDGEPKCFHAEAYKGNDTTNNKMELMAVLDFLKKAQKKGHYTIRTDSAYVITSMQMREQREASRVDDQLFLPSGKPALNSNLLIAIFAEMKRLEDEGSVIVYEKVKGHSGDKMNEFVDRMATNNAQIWKTNKIR